MRDYLEEHQEKLKEDLCWKGLIDDFQDGVILVSQNKEISYKNNPVDVLFGLKNKSSKHIPHSEENKLILKSFKCREDIFLDELNEDYPNFTS